MQYCQYKESCRLQLHVSRHLNPFHPAYMHKKWCRKIDANRQWHGGVGGVGGANNVNLFINVLASSFLTRFSLLQVTA